MIKFTDSAKEAKKTVGSDRFLKIVLEKAGCCSFSFNVYEDMKRVGDMIIEAEDGTEVLINEETLMLLPSGGTIDYGRRGLRKGYWLKPN